MRRRTQILALMAGLALALVLAFGSASAQQDHGMQQGQGMQQRGYGQGMQQGYGQRMPRGYGQGYGQRMSPEQMQQMQQIQAKYADKMYDLRSRLYAKQQELSAAMGGDEVSKSRVRSLVSEVNNLRGELFATQTEMQMEMRQQGLMPGYGGYGMGPGMMGPGMQGGRGMGPGMMGPGMMGPGMHGGGMGRGMHGMGGGMMYR